MRRSLKKKRCRVCNGKFLPDCRNLRVCSDECRAAARREVKNKRLIRDRERRAAEGRAFRPAKTIEGICLYCHNPFTKLARHFASKNKPKYCNIDCYLAHTVIRSSPLLREGDDPYRGGNWRGIRVEVREEDGNQCQLCGKDGAKIHKGLPVDHIIPFRLMVRWGFEPNARGNLITVCDPCHAVKTNVAEPMLLRGDMIGFVLELLAMHYPPDRIRSAFQLAELSTSFLDRQVALAAPLPPKSAGKEAEDEDGATAAS